MLMNGKMKMYSNDLIYGFNKSERVVSVETKGSDLILFQEQEDGSITEEIMDANYWVCTNRKISDKQDILEGNQYYKYLARFDNPDELKAVQDKLYQKRLDFYRIYDNKESNMVLQGITSFKGMKPEDVSILSWDIETSGVAFTKDAEIYLITNTFRKLGKITRKTFSLEDYTSQGEMLTAWCTWVRQMNPSIMCGHNIYIYDYAFIRHVAEIHNVPLYLGRDGSEIKFAEKPSKKRVDGTNKYEFFKVYIFGREICDTYFLSLTFDIGKQFESYGLKAIVKALGMEKEGRSYIDASQIRKYFRERFVNPEMWQKTKLYAEEDSDDALKLFDHMVPAFFYLSQHISKPFTEMINSATGAQINNFLVRAYLQEGHSIAKSSEIKQFEGDKIEGGISFAIPGIYRHLKKIDLKSAYPSQVLRFGLYDKKKDPKAYYLKMVQYFAKERFELKRLFQTTGDVYYKQRDAAAKVFLNSAYGVTITEGLNYNSRALGEKITEATREVIDMSLKWASGKDKHYWIKLFKERIGKDEETDESEIG